MATLSYVAALIAGGDLIKAARVYMEITGSDLDTAQQVIQQYGRTGTWSMPRGGGSNPNGAFEPLDFDPDRVAPAPVPPTEPPSAAAPFGSFRLSVEQVGENRSVVVHIRHQALEIVGWTSADARWLVPVHNVRGVSLYPEPDPEIAIKIDHQLVRMTAGDHSVEQTYAALRSWLERM